MEYKIQYSKIKNIYIQIKEGKVIVKAPKRVTREEIEKILKNKEKWINKSLDKDRKKGQKENLYTKDEFIKIVESTTKELIELTNLKPNNIRIRDISYAWGSCSTNKNITISLKLIKYSKEAIKYVILHELCHLKYMNHSKNFWNLVEKYMPDYKEIKKEFKLYVTIEKNITYNKNGIYIKNHILDTSPLWFI